MSCLDELPSEEALEARCLELGLFMRRHGDGAVGHTAVTLQPLPMPRRALALLYARQLLWNEAVDRTARNFAFLQAALRETGASDVDFTGRFLRILDEVYVQPAPGVAQPVYQPLMLGIVRTDYMQSLGDDDDNNNNNDDDDEAAVARCWKNVEINTISCSFAGLSPQVVQLHRYLQQYRRATAPYARAAHAMPCEAVKSDALHNNNNNNNDDEATGWPEATCSGDAVPAALATAVRAWHDDTRSLTLRAYDGDGDGAAWQQRLQPVVLVVTQERERNTADQYRLLFRLLEVHGVVSVRRTLQQLHDTMQLHDATRTNGNSNNAGATTAAPPFAVLDDRYVVAVAYFRSTYVPSDFPSEACWRARAALERSNAIKCPSVPYHLMTFKKMQQVLTNVDAVLAPISFAGDRAKARALAQHFMPQYSLNAAEYASNCDNNNNDHTATTTASGGSDDDAASVRDPEVWVRAAVAQPTAYVLKPQLEGGGNLIAGETMRQLLATTMPGDPLYARIRKEYILMRRIHFPVTSSVFMQNGTVHAMPHSVCSELGIFGTFLADGVHAPGTHGHTFSQHGGYIVRSKAANVDDGGVMAGVACLDSLLLTS